jgi:hypothetical protein
MNKQSMPVPPDENKIEELLAKIQPIPSESFHQKMKAGWRAEGGVEPPTRNLRLKPAFAIVILFAFLALFVTPQGRAWAQELVQFFKRINSFTIEMPESETKLMERMNDSIDLPLVPVFVPTALPGMAALPGCETSGKSQSYHCQVALAESQLGFDLKELPEEPEGWEFDYLSFDPTSKRATISYTFDQRYRSSATFTLIQGVGDFTKLYSTGPWNAVPADKVEAVKVGNLDAEYVKGSFSSGASGNLVWSDADRHRLAWSDGTRWYLIEVWSNPNPPDPIDRAGLVALAESLVDASREGKEVREPDALHSISEAEEISGMDLKAPTLLPLGIDFESARFYPEKPEVRLFYGINNELVIHQWQGPSPALDTLSTPSTQGYEIIEVNGETAFLGSVGGADAHLFLWWQKDGMSYQMYYYQYFGRTIEKQEFIAIAESLQDIDDFRAKGPPSYEYVSIYEQVLGLNAKEFPAVPVGWSFTGVYAGDYGRCIILSYKLVTEPGSIFIHQCGTDYFYNVADISPDRIEQVQLRGQQGMYAAGDFVASNDGRRTWDPDLPGQQLYWQEDGLWIKVTVWGDNTLVYDKEDLLREVESLR